ncbi:prolipoprotein diacylglyceryl transferase [delta proteobacterium NaphS2]|nr:prolipoprotein diacylglyceryl transferase [delta proteobacterium NaphS2]
MPDLLSVGPITFHTYGLFAAAGFVAGLVLTLKIGRSSGIGGHLLAEMAVYMIPAAIAGSRALYVMMNFGYFSDHLSDILKIWQGGLVFQGGLIAVMLTLFWYVKGHGLSFWDMGDLWAPAAALGQAIGWVGCLMAGCGFGKPTGSFFGIVFTNPHSLAPVGIPLYPTQIFAAAGGLGLTFVLVRILAKKQFAGQVLLWYLILHSTISLFIEKYRGDEPAALLYDTMSVIQGLSLVILAWAVISLFILKSRGRPTGDIER